MTDASVVPDDRRLPLEGAINFRDLGGYPTVDGRRVRRGCLYRSDSLAELTERDLETLAELGLRSLFDLRHDSERRRKPNRLWLDDRLTVHPVGFLPYRAGEMFEGVRAGRLSAAEVDAAVREMYRRLPLDHTDCYARILETLAEPDALPALMHCTSGKDRTGFAAVVVLLALGVDRESILTDYLLTNRYRRDLGFVVGEAADPEIMATLMRAHPEYLDVAFAAMEEAWGDAEGFLHEGLGLSRERRARLQALLLEPGGR